MNLLLDTQALLWFVLFDRLIIAQSLVENIPVVSSDGLFANYGVERIW